jgi:hypothetical protein
MTPPSERDETLHHLVTEEQRTWLFAAREKGRQCAACGRPLRADETVWIERFTGRAGRRPVYYWASVGVECVSAALLAATQSQEPQLCVWCGRGVHYPAAGSISGRTRRRAVCSRSCGQSHMAATQRRRAKGEG